MPSSLPLHLTAPPLPDKKALVLLKERVEKAADPKTELDAIVKRIKGNTNRERLPSSTLSTFMHALRAVCVKALYCAAPLPGSSLYGPHRPRFIAVVRGLRSNCQCAAARCPPPPPSHAIGPLQDTDSHEFAALMWNRAWRSWGASCGSLTCGADFWACAQ